MLESFFQDFIGKDFILNAFTNERNQIQIVIRPKKKSGIRLNFIVNGNNLTLTGISMNASVREALDQFDKYAAMNSPDLPNDEKSIHNLSALQVRLHRWVVKCNFKTNGIMAACLGVTEEVGELARAVLKHHQGIRGYDREKYIESAGDAVADIIIYLMQVCTHLRLDLGTILTKVAEEVMEREWDKHPNDAHERVAV